MKINARRHTTNHEARLSETRTCNTRGSAAAGDCEDAQLKQTIYDVRYRCIYTKK
jgi:hypothetical protein